MIPLLLLLLERWVEYRDAWTKGKLAVPRLGQGRGPLTSTYAN